MMRAVSCSLEISSHRLEERSLGLSMEVGGRFTNFLQLILLLSEMISEAN